MKLVTITKTQPLVTGVWINKFNAIVKLTSRDDVTLQGWATGTRNHLLLDDELDEYYSTGAGS